jgi:hypothetical protein
MNAEYVKPDYEIRDGLLIVGGISYDLANVESVRIDEGNGLSYPVVLGCIFFASFIGLHFKNPSAPGLLLMFVPFVVLCFESSLSVIIKINGRDVKVLSFPPFARINRKKSERIYKRAKRMSEAISSAMG